jgi:hypothetical protein
VLIITKQLFRHTDGSLMVFSGDAILNRDLVHVHRLFVLIS